MKGASDKTNKPKNYGFFMVGSQNHKGGIYQLLKFNVLRLTFQI